MTTYIAPKYGGIAYASALVAITSIAMAVATSVPRWLPVAPPAREPATEVQDIETLRIERATESLRHAASVERTPHAVREEGGETVLPLHSPSATAAAAIESRPIDPSALNVVIVDSGRERTATIDGLRVRVGERTTAGFVVRAIEKTGIVIEDGAGVRRSVDLRDKFVRQDTASSSAPSGADHPGIQK